MLLLLRLLSLPFASALLGQSTCGGVAVWHDCDHPDHLGPRDHPLDHLWRHCRQGQQAGTCSPLPDEPPRSQSCPGAKVKQARGATGLGPAADISSRIWVVQASSDC